MSPLLRRLEPAALARLRRSSDDAATHARAREIVASVRAAGEPRLRALAEELDGLAPGAPLVLGPEALAAAFAGLEPPARALLERTAERIARFALAQRAALGEVELTIPGGRARLAYVPVARAGCYAPGGRHPLPSSVLMTAVSARVAGCASVWLASPRPAAVTLAAAHVAGVEQVLCAGGAQAIAALAHGCGPVPACDVVVGPGNRFVTAAKALVAGVVGIDLLAGPSELVVLADDSAEAALVAADLLAQAEHDPDALPLLVTTSAALLVAVERELVRQLADLPTSATARAALAGGGAVLCADLAAAVAVCNAFAPEHLALALSQPEDVRSRLTNHGALFVAPAAEVLGDYGAGPNHVLPTGGTARFSGGLSVLTFLRARATLELEDLTGARELHVDAAALARLEGLEAHARAAERRCLGRG